MIRIALLLTCSIALGACAAAQSTSTAPAKKAPASAAKRKTATASRTPAKPDTQLTTDKEKASYALGLSVGSNFKKQQLDVDPDIVAKGLRDGYTGAKPLLSEEDATAAFNQLKSETMAKQEGTRSEMTVKNKAEGEQFLAENKTKEGVVSLPSGLQYKILQEGTGQKPVRSDVVVCHYRGTLLNGTEFDSSYKRAQPASFPVSGVIKGWTEALQLMPVGSKWQLFIPPDLAYGERGAEADIGPNSTLVFEVELISIEGK